MTKKKAAMVLLKVLLQNLLGGILTRHKNFGIAGLRAES
jgi:hypothetical protein